MKNILLAYLVLFAFSSAFAQKIELDNYNLSIETTFHGNELKYIDSIFANSNITVSIVRLLPEFDGRNFYPESIILDKPDRERSSKDSLFLADYFIGVDDRLIDTTSLVLLDSIDMKLCLQELLQGPKELSDEEVITACYNPRHAVLFKDDSGEIIAIQEICFECGNTKVGIYTSEMRYNSTGAFRKLFEKYDLLN